MRRVSAALGGGGGTTAPVELHLTGKCTILCNIYGDKYFSRVTYRGVNTGKEGDYNDIVLCGFARYLCICSG